MRYDQPSLPNPNLEERTLEAVARFLLSPECKKVAVISGAGISAANGIPTYRGAGGLYETLDATRLTASAEDRAALATPEAVFSRQLFLRNPLPLP
jgi:NAD-dependent histone deacetylase SIR2